MSDSNEPQPDVVEEKMPQTALTHYIATFAEQMSGFERHFSTNRCLIPPSRGQHFVRLKYASQSLNDSGLHRVILEMMG